MIKTYYYNVKNRSAGAVLYTIPEDNVRRRFAPGETKRISYEELLKECKIIFNSSPFLLLVEYSFNSLSGNE